LRENGNRVLIRRDRILGSNGKVVLDVKGEDEDTEEGNFHHRGSEDTEIKIT
jgi:hypothetical protein